MSLTSIPQTAWSEYVLLTCLELISRSGVAEHDQDAANALDALEMMLSQKGCEHLGAADGKLTTVMDNVIFG